MGKWVKQEGSPDYTVGPGGQRSYVEVYHAASNAGKAEVISRGYFQGRHNFAYDGSQLWLDRVNIRQHPGYDIVTLTWTAQEYNGSGSGPDNRFADGVRRFNGEEEWTIRAALDSETVTETTPSLVDGDQATNWAGTAGFVIGESTMLVPGAVLVWKKWMKKDRTIIPNQFYPTTVPRTKVAALNALQTYMPQQTGTYENGAPKVGKRLDSSGTGAHLLCIGVSLDPDGDLVCRTAEFKWTNRTGGWPSPPYV